MMLKTRFVATAVFFAVAVFSFPGCGEDPKPDPNDPDAKVIATVNGERITSKDIKRELTLRTKQDPTFKITPETLAKQLDIMISRRILIQEASRRHLAEDERFAHTLRGFWEQTLIRGLTQDVLNELGGDRAAFDAWLIQKRLESKVDIIATAKKKS